MGYVHHANYALYLEQARMELLKAMGLDIVALEEQGIILPVASMAIKYIRPIHFGDSITIETKLNIENKYKMELKYQVFTHEKTLAAKATTALVFVKKETGRMIPGIYEYLNAVAPQRNTCINS